MTKGNDELSIVGILVFIAALPVLQFLWARGYLSDLGLQLVFVLAAVVVGTAALWLDSRERRER